CRRTDPGSDRRTDRCPPSAADRDRRPLGALGGHPRPGGYRRARGAAPERGAGPNDRPLAAPVARLHATGHRRPRAVPALIRAIPRTLVEPGSDYGLTTDDAELLAFLQATDSIS